VQGQEQELRRRAHWIHVHDDGPHLPRRLTGEFERERHVLPPRDSVAQRSGEHALLRRGGPLRQRAAAQRRRVPPAQELRSLRVGIEDLTVRREGAKLLRSEEHTSELQSRSDLVCRLLLEKKNNTTYW